MPSIDMPLERLLQYKPALYREPDFDAFWDETVRSAIAQPLNAELIPYPNLETRTVDVYAVRFDGFEGGRLAGWYVRPASSGTFPGVMIYHGYSGRGARPLEMIGLAGQGICTLSLDVRGQNGESQDALVSPDGHYSGWMTKGIRDPKSYYFRYVYSDAVRALELLAMRDEVDETRLAVTGGSQGGAITLAAAALSDRPILALPDVPFLCDFKRAIEITPQPPYTEIIGLLKQFPGQYATVMRTLSYVDCMNLAPRIRCKTVICNCLCDDICPPSTIFGMYHQMTTTDKQIEVYPYHKHETPNEHSELKFKLIMETLNA